MNLMWSDTVVFFLKGNHLLLIGAEITASEAIKNIAFSGLQGLGIVGKPALINVSCIKYTSAEYAIFDGVVYYCVPIYGF